jgi:hypothetical protein
MDRNFYFFANFFLGLTVVAGVFQSIIHLLLGPQLYLLQPFANWFLVTSIIYLTGLLFLLKYFLSKKYWFTFWSGALSTLFIFCQIVLVYIILIFVNNELEFYNILTILLNLAAALIFAFSLMFSRAGERINLKLAGVFMFILNFILGIAFVLALSYPDNQTYNTFEKINQWASLTGSLIPILFIRNFRIESRILKDTGIYSPMRKSVGEILSLLSMVAIILILVFGIWLAMKSYSKLYWMKEGPGKMEELARRFENGTFVNSNGDSLDYLLMKPLKYDSLIRYPMVICLHGGPSRIKKNQVKKINVPQPAPLLTQQLNREKYPSFIFIPQAPPGHSWGGVPLVPDIDTLLIESILALTVEFNIDEKRRYVAGASGGGYGSWHLIGIRPDLFAAAIPVCGGGNPELASNMINTAVWAFHGRADRNVAVKESREMIEAIKVAGGNPLYTEFPYVGHNAWPHVIKTPELLDWLFEQELD